MSFRPSSSTDIAVCYNDAYALDNGKKKKKKKKAKAEQSHTPVAPRQKPTSMQQGKTAAGTPVGASFSPSGASVTSAANASESEEDGSTEKALVPTLPESVAPAATTPDAKPGYGPMMIVGSLVVAGGIGYLFLRKKSTTVTVQN